MTKGTQVAAAVAVAGMLASSAGSASATTQLRGERHRAVYALQGDARDGFPYRIVLRHCAPAEDSLATLRLVDYRPADGVAVYRCVAV